MGNRPKAKNGGRMPAGPAIDEAFLVACTQMAGRTGATALQLRYSDDERPVVWMAVVEHGGHYAVGAGLHPEKALMEVLEELVDGGTCQHCQRPTAITRDFDEQLLEAVFCWYQYDPELKTFRRGCA